MAGRLIRLYIIILQYLPLHLISWAKNTRKIQMLKNFSYLVTQIKEKKITGGKKSSGQIRTGRKWRLYTSRAEAILTISSVYKNNLKTAFTYTKIFVWLAKLSLWFFWQLLPFIFLLSLFMHVLSLCSNTICFDSIKFSIL